MQTGLKVYLTFSVSTSIFILTQKSSRSNELLNANRDDYDDGRFVGGMIELVHINFTNRVLWLNSFFER